MAKIRLMTKNAPLFDHAGLVLRPQWSEVDLNALGQDGRFAIEKYNGQILMVHPHDAAAYADLVAANEKARSAQKSVASPKSSKKDA